MLHSISKILSLLITYSARTAGESKCADRHGFWGYIQTSPRAFWDPMATNPFSEASYCKVLVPRPTHKRGRQSVAHDREPVERAAFRGSDRLEPPKSVTVRCGLRETRRSWGMATDLQDPWKLRPAGLEPATDGLENRCSIRLSYGRIARRERRVDGPDTQARCGSDCARQDLNLRPAV